MKRQTVVAIIISIEGLLMLKRRPDDRTLPNVWCLPGGKVDEGESLKGALKREVLEETNLVVLDESPHPMVINENEKFIINYFGVVPLNPMTDIRLSDEHCDHRMIPIRDLPMYKEHIGPKTYEALDKLFFSGIDMPDGSKFVFETPTSPPKMDKAFILN